eukprot:1134406-Pelagomonas_calceolata.AAC.3
MEVPDGVVTATYLITYPDGTSRSTAATNARNLANADLTSSLGFTATNVQQADITDGGSMKCFAPQLTDTNCFTHDVFHALDCHRSQQPLKWCPFCKTFAGDGNGAGASTVSLSLSVLLGLLALVFSI